MVVLTPPVPISPFIITHFSLMGLVLKTTNIYSVHISMVVMSYMYTNISQQSKDQSVTPD